MSTDPAADLHRAEVTAANARKQLDSTVSQLQARLDPKLLAQEAKDAGTAAARAGVEQARQNPGIVAGAVAATGLFLLRGRIAAFFRRRRARRPVPAQARSTPASFTTSSEDRP